MRLTDDKLAQVPISLLGDATPKRLSFSKSNRSIDARIYITLTNHVYSPIPLAISEKTWQKLSPQDQAAVMKAAQEAADWSRKNIRDNDELQLKDMESKGAKVSRPDIGPWRDAVKPVTVEARKKYGADVDAILADAEAVREALPAR